MDKTINFRSNQPLLTRAATSRVLLPSEFQDKARLAIRTLSKILLSAVLFALVNMVANAQEKAPPGPIQIISTSEFNTMVKAGQLKVASPEVVLGQYLQRLLRGLKNQAVVDEFMRENPNLRGFAALVAAHPTSPDVFPTVDGDYRMVITNKQNVTQVIETNGQEEKLAELATSIQTARDPVYQRAIYQSVYSKYTTLYDQLCAIPVGNLDISPPPAGCADLAVPSTLTNPSALQKASLEGIHTALQSIFSQGLKVYQIVPKSAGGVACSAEIGASVVADNVFYGDQTQSSGSCTIPSSSGIVANFDFPSKRLLSCIKNQGNRGLCHIFAAVSGLEELIARDTGNHVNLSEQDLTEHEKLIWVPDFFHDGGNAYQDLTNAASFDYHFAYENQWDYNPSLSQPQPGSGYEWLNSCNNYPSTEPGCSDSTPQATQYCTLGYTMCGFTPPVLPGANSPYMVNVVQNLYSIPQDLGEISPYSLFNTILSFLAFNDAVILGFNETNAFQGAPGGYVPCCGFDLASSVGVHITHVVGYVSNSDLASNPNTANQPPGAGGGYFIIKNSWGACLGDAGYYYMPVTYLELEATQLVMVETHGT